MKKIPIAYEMCISCTFRTRLLIGILLFLPIFCFAQQLIIVGGIPHHSDTRLYRIQAGSYRETANAERAFHSLRAAGLNPVYENYMDGKRVVLAGINARYIPLLLDIIRAAGFVSVWIREDITSSNVSIEVIGSGAVTKINSSVTGPLAIVQTIPSFSSSGENTYQANAPIVFFFNNKIYLDSVDGNIDVAVDGRLVNGTAVINEGANGFAVLTFTPSESFPVGKEISITLKKELQNDGGNQMQGDVIVSYVAEKGSDTDFSDNFGFESGSNGVVFSGDGAIDTARGDLIPHEGSHYAAISTGDYVVSTTGKAIGSRTSQIQLGPVQKPFSSMGFYYDFISTEFNDFVGSKYDDTAMVTIYGPKGTHTEIITSVNKIGYNNTRFSNFPKKSDSYAGHTGWQSYRIENIDVGSPAYIIFTVTDVGDNSYPSILAVDTLDLK